MKNVVILGSARTPIGAFQGTLSGLGAPELGAAALAAAIERSGVARDAIEQVYLGSVLTAGVGQAPARQAALAAGCPTSTGAVTVGKVCGSAMRAVMMAANDLRCEDYLLVAAGGMESMSQAPFLVPGARDGLRLGHGKLTDSMIHDGLWDPYGDKHMGSCAELCAARYDFSREQQDAYAGESYRRARTASEDGTFDEEIASVEVPKRGGEMRLVDRDEEPFRVDLEKMPRLRPAFEPNGTVTAANASKINDGAAALVLTTADQAVQLGAEPVARLVAQASWAQDPDWFTTAPISVVGRALERAGLTVGDIDLWEVNEAFAVVALAFIRDLELDPAAVNVHGGAVALGHPIGASGARILVTLLNALKRRGARLGCAAICIGGGEATAMIVENLE
jgi:acetyl-CoA C-acetyltransferase